MMRKERPGGILRQGFVRMTLGLLLLALAAGCAGQTPQTRFGKNATPGPEVDPPAGSKSQQVIPPPASLETRLRVEVRRWQGTPHKMGGTSRKGVDCSGFVQQLYRDLFNRSIPRSTSLQVQSGRPVPLTQLSPGDLVFFKPPYKVRHVGIYLGEGQFAHASTSKGVMISSLSEAYWRKCYWTARRYPLN